MKKRQTDFFTGVMLSISAAFAVIMLGGVFFVGVLEREMPLDEMGITIEIAVGVLVAGIMIAWYSSKRQR